MVRSTRVEAIVTLFNSTTDTVRNHRNIEWLEVEETLKII